MATSELISALTTGHCETGGVNRSVTLTPKEQ
jgi:hypothetical protein